KGVRSAQGIFNKILPLSGCAFQLRLKVQGDHPWPPVRRYAAHPPFSKEGFKHGCGFVPL
ncbi:MAG: hypothetical protein KGJ17_05015, partial [Gammaproteobacteria bacterium]|nr:hypothetical protein [Gammaproteobacteria bacterium]